MSARHDQAGAPTPPATNGADVDREARADLLVRMVHAVLDEARPPLASSVWTARIACDELRAMASPVSFRPSQVALQAPFEALQVGDLAALARAAQLQAWRRIERFAALVAAAAVPATPPSESHIRSAGAGLAAAVPSAPAPQESNP